MTPGAVGARRQKIMNMKLAQRPSIGSPSFS
jgi:hypothetical protein